MARKLERKTISQTITVRDTINGGEFGEVLNITIEGLMLLLDREISAGSIFQLSLQLPTPIAGSDTIELGADCLWSRKAENFHRYWAGFQIIDASDKAIEQIEQLISDYAAD